MDRKFIDFDAALAEAEDQPIVLRFQGRDWELFSALPAKPVLKLMRLQAKGQGKKKLARAEMLDLLCELVPADAFNAWLDGGLTINQLARLLKAIMAAYKTGGEEGDEGEAGGPEAGPTPSSSTGPR